MIPWRECVCGWLSLLLLASSIPARAAAPGTAETKAFAAAGKAFQDKLYPLAEKSFAEFVSKYPESGLKAEASLYMGMSRFYQQNLDGAVEVFRNGLKEELKLGATADQYFFWLGEALFQKGEYQPAADAYAEVARRFPISSRRLEASYNEALCYSKVGNWARVADLLLRPEGAFQTVSKPQPRNELVMRGRLLLAEALYRLNRYAEAQGSLDAIPLEALPEINWRRQYLQARIHLSTGQAGLALPNVTNMNTLAASSGQRVLNAETAFVEGEVFEALNRRAEAVQAYERNLLEGNPAETKRRALAKVVELMIDQRRTSDAIKRLETFIEQNPRDPTMDLARLSFAELLLRQYYELAETRTNAAGRTVPGQLLDQALTNLVRVAAEFPSSSFMGRVLLSEGWCYWAKGEMPAAERSFADALKKLPPFSEDQAVALFKTADAQFQNENYESAIANYNLLLQNYGSLPRVKGELFGMALYQVLRASLASGNQAMARDAMGRVLENQPAGGFTDRSVLLVGQDLSRTGKPAEARGLFMQFTRQFTNSTLLAEVQLAVARTYAQEQNWNAAIAQYDGWVTNFTSHPLVPEAEFSRALTYFHAGLETNALSLFTNFVARFSTNQLAARAQNWVATYYFNRDDFANAEKNYQLLYQKLNPDLELSLYARLNAGRAAFELQQLRDARKYFAEVVTETNAPAGIAAEAWFALGDTIFQQFLASTNKAANTDTFNEAIRAFTRITQDYSTNRLATLAWGRLGDCHVQWAELMSDKKALDLAAEAYTNVLAQDAERETRHQAEVGLARVMEKKGQPDAALEHYGKVLYAETENADPFWLKEAALGAARVCESTEQWEQAMNVYKRLAALLPATQPAMEKRIASARQKWEQLKSEPR